MGKMIQRGIGRKTAEEFNKNKNKWSRSFSKNIAINNSGRKKIYRLPNGLYIWRR